MYEPTSLVNAEPKRHKARSGSEVFVLTRSMDDGETCEVHGVFSTWEKADKAAQEWMGRDCSVKLQQLSTESWVVDG